MALIEVYHRTRGLSRCRSCDAVIEWGQAVKSGKKVPFDGEMVVVQTKQHPETGAPIDVVDSSISPVHFQTCKDAQKWRKRS